MPEREQQMNPTPDPLAVQLQQLTPQMQPGLSRDAILFAAGKAAAAPTVAPWIWPSATGVFAALSVVLAAFLWSPGANPGPVQYVERVVYLEHPPAPADALAPSVRPSATSTSPETTPVAHVDDEQPTLAEQLKMRNEVLRFGVEMLPKSTVTQTKTPDLNDREFARWLNVPPGTFTIHRQPPKKPTTMKTTEED